MVSLEQGRVCVKQGLKIKLGEKLCSYCRKMLFTTPANHDSDEEDLQLNDDDDCEINELQKEDAIDSINASLTDVGWSPFKLHALV